MSNINCIGYWEPCTRECGEGTQKFTVITPKSGTGTSCAATDGQTMSCKKKDCPTCRESCTTGWTLNNSACLEDCPKGSTINMFNKNQCILPTHMYNKQIWENCPSGYTQLPYHCNRDIQIKTKQSYIPRVFQSDNLSCPANSYQI